MADEKTLHIKADVQGGDPALDAEIESAIFDEAVSNAEAMKALESFIFATQEMKDKFESEQPDAEKRKPGRPRIHPLPTPEEEESRRKQKGLNSLLDNFQKVVIALNGTNGRTTKAMAVFNRVIKFSAESLENYSQAQKDAQESVDNTKVGDPQDKEENPLPDPVQTPLPDTEGMKEALDKFTDNIDKFVDNFEKIPYVHGSEDYLKELWKQSQDEIKNSFDELPDDLASVFEDALKNIEDIVRDDNDELRIGSVGGSKVWKEMEKEFERLKDLQQQARDTVDNMANGGGGGNEPPNEPPQGPPDDDNGGNRFSKLWAGLNTGAKALQANFAAVATTGATVVGGFAAVTTATILFGKLLTNTARSLVQMTDGFSAAVNIAKAQSELAMIQAKMRTANEAGGELAGLEKASSNFEVAVQDFWTKLTEMFGPMLKIIIDVITRIMEIINVILGTLNGIFGAIGTILDTILQIAEYIPFIGSIATDLRNKFTSDKIKEANSIADLNINVGEIFNPTNFDLDGLDKNRSKNLRKRGFLQ